MISITIFKTKVQLTYVCLKFCKKDILVINICLDVPNIFQNSCHILDLIFNIIYSASMKQQNKVKRKPFFRFVKWVLRLFVRKPKIITDNETLDPNAIYLSNHVGATAPIKHELYFPYNFKFWGTHEMVCTLKERWRYLAYNYLPKKKHIGKFMSKIIATIILPFVSGFYRGLQILPTYTDGKLLKTMHDSTDYLKQGNSIIIFPEDSSEGYWDTLKEYFAGFLLLAKHYYKYTNHNIKIYNMYFNKKNNTLAIDTPITIEEILKDKRDIREIANTFKDRANELRTKTLNK